MTTESVGGRRLARWLARLEAAAPLIRMAMLTLTGVSTALVGLAQYGYAGLAEPLVVAGAVVGVLGVYAYAESGVFNQQKKDRVDLGRNFANPGMRIDDELIGCAVYAAVHGEAPDEADREAISEAVDGPWRDYRAGLDLDD